MEDTNVVGETAMVEVQDGDTSVPINAIIDISSTDMKHNNPSEKLVSDEEILPSSCSEASERDQINTADDSIITNSDAELNSSKVDKDSASIVDLVSSTPKAVSPAQLTTQEISHYSTPAVDLTENSEYSTPSAPGSRDEILSTPCAANDSQSTLNESDLRTDESEISPNDTTSTIETVQSESEDDIRSRSICESESALEDTTTSEVDEGSTTDGGDTGAGNEDEETETEGDSDSEDDDKESGSTETGSSGSDTDNFEDEELEEGEIRPEDKGDEYYSGEEEEEEEKDKMASAKNSKTGGSKPWIGEKRHSGDGEVLARPVGIPKGNIPIMDNVSVQEQPDNDSGSQNGTDAAVAEKVVDDDEDRKNPAYIPRKGYFFEHDMRGGDDAEEEASKKEAEKIKNNKKLWKEELKWGHDKYDEQSMAPKTRDELIEQYGYDIREGDGGGSMREGGGGRGRRGTGGRGGGGTNRGRGQRFGDYLERDWPQRRNETAHRNSRYGGGRYSEEREISTRRGSGDADLVPRNADARTPTAASISNNDQDKRDDRNVRLSVSQPKETTTTSSRRDEYRGVRDAAADRSQRDATEAVDNRQGNNRGGDADNRQGNNRGGDADNRHGNNRGGDADNRHGNNRGGDARATVEPSLHSGDRLPTSRWVSSKDRNSTVILSTEKADTGRAPAKWDNARDRQQNSEPHDQRTGGRGGGNSWQNSDRRAGNGGDNRDRQETSRYGDNNRGDRRADGDYRRDVENRRDGENRDNRRDGDKRRAGSRATYDDNRKGYGGDRPRNNYGNSDRDYDRDYNDRQRPRDDRTDDRVSGSNAQHATRTIQNSGLGRYDGGGNNGGRSYNRGSDDRYGGERTLITTPAKRSQDARFDEEIVGGIRNITVNASASSQVRAGGATGHEVGGRQPEVARQTEKRSTTIVQADAAEIIPPVTRVNTYPRPIKAVNTTAGRKEAANERANASSTTSNESSRGWAGGEFTPAWQKQANADNNSESNRALAEHQQHAESEQSAQPHVSKASKRYSSQRTRGAEGPTGGTAQEASSLGGVDERESPLTVQEHTMHASAAASQQQRQQQHQQQQQHMVAYYDPHQQMHAGFPPAPIVPLAASYPRMALQGGGGLSSVGQQYRLYPSVPAPPPGLMPPPMGHQLHYMQSPSGPHMLTPGTYMSSPQPGHPQLVSYTGGPPQVLRPPPHYQIPAGAMQISATRSSPSMAEVVSPTMEMQHGGVGMFYTLPDGSRVRSDMMPMYYGQAPQGMIAGGIGGGQPVAAPPAAGRSRSPPRRHTAAIPIVNPQEAYGQPQYYEGYPSSQYEEQQQQQQPSYGYVDAQEHSAAGSSGNNVGTGPGAVIGTPNSVGTGPSAAEYQSGE